MCMHSTEENGCHNDDNDADRDDRVVNKDERQDSKYDQNCDQITVIKL
jgi:hypothetical protein